MYGIYVTSVQCFPSEYKTSSAGLDFKNIYILILLASHNLTVDILHIQIYSLRILMYDTVDFLTIRFIQKFYANIKIFMSCLKNI
jgi:hypothetical protein